jgi:hypothetical protein
MWLSFIWYRVLFLAVVGDPSRRQSYICKHACTIALLACHVVVVTTGIIEWYIHYESVNRTVTVRWSNSKYWLQYHSARMVHVGAGLCVSSIMRGLHLPRIIDGKPWPLCTYFSEAAISQNLRTYVRVWSEARARLVECNVAAPATSPLHLNAYGIVCRRCDILSHLAHVYHIVWDTGL